MRYSVIVGAALVLLGQAAAAFDVPMARQLGRVIVTHCYMENPEPSVVIVEHPQVYDEGLDDMTTVEATIEVDADPVSPDVGCRVLDSAVQGINFSGTLMTWGPVGGAIQQVMYTVSVTDGENTYRLADWANAVDWSPNGARYTVASNLLLDANGASDEYDVTFIRRAPKERLTWVDGFGEALLPIYDPVTIMRINRITDDGFISVIADYRDVIDN